MQLLASELAAELRALDVEVAFDAEGRIVLSNAETARAIKEAFESAEAFSRAFENKGCLDMKNFWCPGFNQERSA